MQTQLALEAIGPVIHGYHENPFEVLGPHEIEADGRRAIAVRAFLPDAQRAWVVDPTHGETRPMRRVHPAGLYEAIVDPQNSAFDPQSSIFDPRNYMLRATSYTGETTTMHDPYAFEPLLTEYDLHLLSEGTHWKSYERLGAHPRTVGGVKGVNFAVWAPNAESVGIIGDFNGWNGRQHMMRKHIPSGVWELFIPGLGRGHALQVRREASRWARGREVRSLRLRGRDSAEDGQHRHRSRHATSGTTTSGSPAGRSTTRSMRRCRSTKSTWAVGGATRPIRSGGSATGRSPRSWPSTASKWATRTSS